MKFATLNECSLFIRDGTHNTPEKTDTGVPVLSARNVIDGRLNFDTDRYASYEELIAFRKRLFPKPGDVLLTIVGTIGRTAVVLEEHELIFQRSVCVIRPNNELLDSLYLRYVLESDFVQNQFEKEKQGVAQVGIYLETLNEILIPLPPLEEQRRIAGLLSQADRLRRLRRYSLKLSETFLQSVFLEMFGDPVRNERGWKNASLRELGKVTTGSTPPSRFEGMFGGSIPYITPGDLTIDTLHTMRFVTEEGAKHSDTVRSGSTMVCCIGATIGKIDKARSKCAFNQQINAIQWNNDINDEYGLMAMKFFSKIIAERGSSTTLPILKKSEFEEITIPIPPMNVQKKFEILAMRFEHYQAQQRESLRQAEGLFAGLLGQVFG